MTGLAQVLNKLFDPQLASMNKYYEDKLSRNILDQKESEIDFMVNGSNSFIFSGPNILR